MSDEELPPYKLNITKSRAGGGPTQYPSHDKVIAEVTVPSTPYPTEYAFPFVGEKRVATALEDDHVFHRVLRDNGIEPDPDSHGLWDARVSTFDAAGVGRGDSVNQLDAVADGGESPERRTTEFDQSGRR